MSHIHQTEVVIDAPIEAVWDVLVDTAAHRDWSDSFALHDPPHAGLRSRVAFWVLGRPLSHPIVYEVVEPPHRLEWRGGPRALVSGRHYFRLEVDEGGADRTRFVHGEEFSGAAVRVLWPLLMRALGPAYDRFNAQLAGRVEGARARR